MDKRHGGEIWKHCRHKLKHRKRNKLYDCSSIPNRLSIKDRPKEFGKRFGDWEMDTIVGPNNHGAIVTLVEKSTNFLLMKRLPQGKNALQLAKIVVDMLLPYKDFVLTITTDNGKEFFHHQYIASKLSTQIYFMDPYSSWQKGCIENTNKLIRQYIPKSAPLNTFSDTYIAQTQFKINRRPRKKTSFCFS